MTRVLNGLTCVVLVTFGLIACDGMRAAGFGSNKKRFLSNARIFAESDAQAVKDVESGGDDLIPPPAPQPTPTPVVPPPNPDTIGVVPTNSLCTDMGTGGNSGVNLKTLDDPEVVVSTVDLATEVCKFEGTKTKNVLLNMKKLALTDMKKTCPDIQTGEYNVNLKSKSKNKGVLFHGTAEGGMYGNHKGFKIRIKRSGNGDVEIERIGGNDNAASDQILREDLFGGTGSAVGAGPNWLADGMKLKDRVLYATNSGGAIMPVGSGTDAVECDLNWSPLMVQLSDDHYSKIINFTPISFGVLFDILGENAKPVAHTKKRISWFKDIQSATFNQWLVRPRGIHQVVEGINDMFGDQTLGPDGKFAANGFTALAKYDLNHDNKIDGNDRVYYELSLWADRNKDGVAGFYEMTTLDKAGIEFIDLAYDPHFKETDQYGNQARYKSVAKMKNGRLNLVYDVWFRTLD